MTDPAQSQFVLLRLVHRLWGHLSRRRKRQFQLLLVLTLACAFAEVISLSAVVPFLNVLIEPERALKLPTIAHAAKTLGLNSGSEVLFALTVAFVVAALTAAGLRLWLVWAGNKVSFASVADLSLEVYRRTLYQPYQVHTQRNSSEMINSMSGKVNAAATVLQQIITLISSAVLIVAIVVALLSIDANVTILSALAFGFAYSIITWLVRKRIDKNSRLIAAESTQIIKAIQEGLGAIRDVLLDGSQKVYCEIYRRSDQPLRMAVANNIFIANCPRYLMEALGMTLIAMLAYGVSRDSDGSGSILPSLGALALGAQRVLPAMQQTYLAWSNIVGSKASLVDALALLDQPLPADAMLPAPDPLAFRNSIHIANASYRYLKDGPWVLRDVDIIIPKGARIGIVGSTGSGKSTLLDLLMALMEPTEGRLLVDDNEVTEIERRAWQRNIAHVPQHIYLTDASFAENIAFGINPANIDLERVKQVAKQAKIDQFIESRGHGYEEIVGERGIRISGGERQRIGIARALYKQASVLVFDEATSALDNKTEREVMKAIEGLNRELTIIIVAHRLTTVTRCDTIFELAEGKVVAQGDYESLLKTSASFRTMAHQQ